MQAKPTHFMSMVKLGPKGQIVIPKEIRDMFGIGPGDSLIIMADSRRGIALSRQDALEKIADSLFRGIAPGGFAEGTPEQLSDLAGAIQTTITQGECKK